MAFPALLSAVQDAGQDFEWYPTTDRMIAAVAARIPTDTSSIMDIGAGDGRVLVALSKKCDRTPELFAIEKSPILIQAQPEGVIPVGTEFFEQNLACLPVDIIFCNPPYSDFEAWASLIVEMGYAKRAFLVLPRRWKESVTLAASIKKRGVTTRVIHSDDFKSGADRTARAVVDIVEVSFPKKANSYRDEAADPFDAWFDENISAFDEEVTDRQSEEAASRELVRLRQLDNIPALVAAHDEELARLESNYRAVFSLDYAILKELGVSKDGVRDGIKTKMAGLKTKYWKLLFDHLESITARLSTATKAAFVEKLSGRATIAFTAKNVYAIVVWAIKNANQYFDEQTVALYRAISTFDGVKNYASNRRTWERDAWRYASSDYDRGHPKPSHYALDYRIVVERYQAIYRPEKFGGYEYPGNLHRRCHELIADCIAVLGNLGFRASGVSSLNRAWYSGDWHNWYHGDSDDVLFQVKAYMNGNVHFRFMPDAIKALNVEAGRLLGWLRTPADVETELGYTADEAKQFFHSTARLGTSGIALLGAATLLTRRALAMMNAEEFEALAEEAVRVVDACASVADHEGFEDDASLARADVKALVAHCRELRAAVSHGERE